jgi:hypothetical protein
VLGKTEILWSFQKFWNRCVGSNRDSVVVPEILESLCWVKQRFCGRSRNSGIAILGQTNTRIDSILCRIKCSCKISRKSGSGLWVQQMYPR